MRTEHPAAARPETISKARLEAFSDGVIAVAITLLVLDLRAPIPGGGGRLGHELADLWPNYLAYVISFVAIGIIWINHHALLRRLTDVDHAALVLNLLLLLCIVALPFTTSLLANYLDAADGAHLAAIVYATSFLVTSAVFLALEFHLLVRRPHLLHEALAAPRKRAILRRAAAAPPTYLVAAVLGLVSPDLTLAVCVAAGIFYLLAPRAGQTPSRTPAS